MANSVRQPQSAPSARRFCQHHPDGVTCGYCASRPSASPSKIKRTSHAAQQFLDKACIAQRAYWNAMCDLEMATGLDIDWENCNLTGHTLATLREEYPAAKG